MKPKKLTVILSIILTAATLALAGTRGDLDADSDIDLWDYTYFWDCMMDPEAAPALPCDLHFDTDDDGVISLLDFANLQRSMTAPTD